MSDYRRNYQPGATYFFTVVTHRRRPVFQSQGNVERLKHAIRFVRSKKPFGLVAIVVLPDHLHCIWTMTGDADYSLRWQMIKTYFSRYTRPLNGNGPAERVWQPRFWEHMIRNERDYERHLHYVHFNPVKHGYVSRPADWPYSSFNQFVRLGWYQRDWGKVQPDLIASMNPE